MGKKFIPFFTLLILFLFTFSILICANRKQEGQETPCPGSNCCEPYIVGGHFYYNIYYCNLRPRHCSFTCLCVCNEYSEANGYQQVTHYLKPVRKNYWACIEQAVRVGGGDVACAGESTEPSQWTCQLIFNSMTPCETEPSNLEECRRYDNENCYPPGCCIFESIWEPQ